MRMFGRSARGGSQRGSRHARLRPVRGVTLTWLAVSLGTGLGTQACDPDDEGCRGANRCPSGFECTQGLCLQVPSDAAQVPLDAAQVPLDAAEPTSPDAGAADADVDPCDGVTCSGHGTCEASSGEARCLCEAGYSPLALECVAEGSPPTAAFSISMATSTVQELLTLDASASTGTGLIFRWDFEGDENFDLERDDDPTVRWRWHAPADYTVRLEVQDALGRTAEASQPLKVTWFGRPGWVGVGNNIDGDFAWWTVLDLEGGRVSDTQLRSDDDPRSYTRSWFSRQASDGRILTGLECLSSLTCDQNEVVFLGRGGKTGVFFSSPTGFRAHDLLELPDGTWLLSDRQLGEIQRVDEDGTPLGVWARGLNAPSSLELTADGAGVLVALRSAGRIERWTLEGDKVGRWDAVGHLGSPHQIRRSAAGGYLVADLAGKVVAFAPDGSFVRNVTAPSQVVVPASVAELADGRVLIGETCTTSLDRCGSVKVLDVATGELRPWAPRQGDSWVLWNPDGLVVVNE
jgi:hypothetical protein